MSNSGSHRSSGSHPELGTPPNGVLAAVRLGGKRWQAAQCAPILRPAQCAAQYVRMSTEHQRYSTENQSYAMREYAEKRGLEIVCTYAHEGKSGLRLDGRDALNRLIADVGTGQSDFSTILVTMSAAGADFRTPTRAHTTSTSAKGLESTSSTAPSSSKAIAALFRPLSKVPSGGRGRKLESHRVRRLSMT